MNIKNKRSVLLLVTILVPAAAASVFAATELPKYIFTEPSVIDFGVEPTEEPIVLSKGETKVIPLNVFGPREVPLNIKIAVVAKGEETSWEHRGEQKLPLGLTAVLSKTEVSLPAEAEQGLAIREKINLTLTALPTMQEGTYMLSFIAIRPNPDVSGSGSLVYHYTQLQVQGFV